MGLVDNIVSAESGGDPNAKNPNSSASGPSQFINSTWLDTIKRARPDLAEGKSDSDLIALKSDPQLSREMTAAYAQQNQDVLSKNNLPVTPGTTYLAHFAGPQGAVKVLQADPNAPVSDILGPKVVAANPFLKDMTAQGLQAWAAKKMGAESPLPQPQNNAPAGNSGPPAPPMSLAPPQTPIFPPQPQQAEAPAPQFAQIPEQQMPPIFYAPRKPVNLAALRNAFHPPVFPQG